MTSTSTGPDRNIRWQILYEPWQLFKLCARDINASLTAAVALEALETDCDDEWQVVNASSTTFGIRSLKTYSDGQSNLLAVFSTGPSDGTAANIIFPNTDDDFPTNAQWELEEALTNIYRVQNSANGSDWYLGAADTSGPGGAVFMRDDWANLTAVGKWSFNSVGVISSSATATSTVSLSGPEIEALLLTMHPDGIE